MIILAVLLLIIGSITYKRFHSLFHPITISVSVWGILLLCYKLINHGLYDLSIYFYLALLLYLSSFSLFCLIGQKCILGVSKEYSGERHEKELSYPKVVTSLNLIFIICLIITILSIYFIRGFNLASLLSDARENAIENGEGLMILPRTFYPIEKVATVSYVMCFYNFIINNKSKVAKALILLTFIYFCFRADKTSFVMFGVGFLYIATRKGLKFIKIIYAILLLLLIIILIELGREGRGIEYIGKFLAIYLLSPLPAFDLVLNMNTDWISRFAGEHMFRYFAQIVGEWPKDAQFIQVSEFDNFVLVPLPTNVFTVMKSAFMDWGYMGITIFGSVYGFIWGWLYRMSKNSIAYQLVYATFIWMLVMQFFSDWINWGSIISNSVTILVISNFQLIKHKIRDTLNYNG